MFVQLGLSEFSAGASEAAAATESATLATAEASTATLLSALTVTLTIALLLLEHAEQLLGSEDRGELGAILLLDIQAELLLLDLLCFVGEDLVELCRGLLVGEVFLVAIGIAVAVLLSAGGCQFFEVTLVDGFELGLLLALELQVLDQTLGHAGLHFLTTCGTIVIILCVYGTDGAKKEGCQNGENYILFHCFWSLSN